MIPYYSSIFQCVLETETSKNKVSDYSEFGFFLGLSANMTPIFEAIKGCREFELEEIKV